MKWPPWRRETRQSATYTDAYLGAGIARAEGQASASATATAALEAAAGLTGRAFAAAEVTAPATMVAALSPACLNMIGRELIRAGEIVFLIDVDDGEVMLLPADSWDVQRGGPKPRDWLYRVTVPGPGTITTYSTVPSEGVVHLRYAVDPVRPWEGRGPIAVAALAGQLSAETTAALANEAGMPIGGFLVLPKDGDDETVGPLKADVKTAKGNILPVEGGDWDTGDPGKSASYTVRRFGAAPPQALVEQQKIAFTEVLSACGINESMFADRGSVSLREAYRVWLHTAVAPMGRMIESELAMKLEADIKLGWLELRSGDVVGRARAFQSLVGGGMDMAAAAAASGILLPAETP